MARRVRHLFLAASAQRYVDWCVAYIEKNESPPSLDEIEAWLTGAESYADSLDALRDLCIWLRDTEQHVYLAWIVFCLISETRDNRKFIGTTQNFFDACASRFGE